jgi:hypothetical protein
LNFQSEETTEVIPKGLDFKNVSSKQINKFYGAELLWFATYLGCSKLSRNIRIYGEGKSLL